MRQILDTRRLNSEITCLAIYGLFSVLVVIFFTLLISANPMNSLAYLLIFLLFVICLVPILVRIRAKAFDLLELIHVILPLYLLYFGIRAAWILTNSPHVRTAPNLNIIADINIITLALFYILIGVVALIMGYYSRLPTAICKVLPRLKFSWNNERRIIKHIYILYGIGFFFRLFAIAHGLFLVFGVREIPIALTTIVHIFGRMPLFAYALYAVYFFSAKDRRPSRIVGVIMLISEVSFAFISGWRGNFIILLLISLIAYHYGRRKLRIRQIVIFLAIVMFAVFPLVTAYRAVYHVVREENVSALTGRGFLRLVSATLEEMKEQTLREHITYSSSTFMNRFIGIDSLAVTIKLTPEVMDFQLGRTITPLFLLPIPRAIFPDKPDLSLGGMFGVKFWGWPEDPWHGSAAITQVGEFYLNFHLAGIILGMFLSGIIYRLTYLYFIKQGTVDKRIGVFLYSVTFFHLIGIESNIAIAYAGLLQTFLVGLLIAWLLSVRIRWGA